MKQKAYVIYFQGLDDSNWKILGVLTDKALVDNWCANVRAVGYVEIEIDSDVIKSIAAGKGTPQQ